MNEQESQLSSATDPEVKRDDSRLKELFRGASHSLFDKSYHDGNIDLNEEVKEALSVMEELKKAGAILNNDGSLQIPPEIVMELHKEDDNESEKKRRKKAIGYIEALKLCCVDDNRVRQDMEEASEIMEETGRSIPNKLEERFMYAQDIISNAEYDMPADLNEFFQKLNEILSDEQKRKELEDAFVESY